VDLNSEGMDVEELLRSCPAFDGTVPGIHHMPGGEKAGQARWEAFKKSGLSQYAVRRNNPMLRYLDFSAKVELRLRVMQGLR
jgi:deoxyribodipyrimidine photolyase